MKSKRAIQVVSAHAEGEVGRVIVGGVLPPPGDTLPDQRAWLERNDGLRRFLIHEPRGGVFTHYNLIVPPRDPRAAAGFIVMEPTDYPAMSGSNSICVATVLLETGMVEMREPVTHFALETPGGLVEIAAECRGGVCERVTTRNVPSFVHDLDRTVEVAGIGTVRLDIAWGGAFFALVEAADLGFALVPGEARALVEAGEAIKCAVRAGAPVRHPATPGFEGVTFVTFLGPVTRENGIRTARSATVISPGKIDRSPCGTGSSARVAVMHARGELAPEEPFLSRSLLRTEFRMTIAATSEVAGRPAVVPEISGRAWITGEHTFHLDPGDPFPEGYRLSDTWYRAGG